MPTFSLFTPSRRRGHSNEKNEETIMAEIENLKTEHVTEDELKKVKRNAKAGFIRSLQLQPRLSRAVVHL